MRMFSIVIAVTCFASLAHASEVYKCTDAHGDVAFQDQPCAQDRVESRVHIDSAPSGRSAPVATDTNAPSPPMPAQPARVDVAPAVALPSLWICENAENGKTYFSENGTPPVRYVPLGVLGYPGQSLAQAYGPGGTGVSAPELHNIPIDRSPDAALAAQYTPVQDQCARATRAQTCEHLRAQYDAIHEKLRRAFKDEQSILQPQQDALAGQLEGC